MKLEEFLLDPTRASALKLGVQTMKSRRPSDPTSWFFQAAVHAVSDEAIAEAAAEDPAVAQVDQAKFWNKCPHFGQPSADFLLWHRGYVYYFERILRAASGDSSLSLPYWNYTDPAQRVFPAVFADPEPDQANNPTNPLFDGRREQAFMFGLYQLTAGAVSTARAFQENRFFGPTEITGFAGGVSDSNGDTKGFVELSPHDLMHVSVGGLVVDAQGNQVGGLMTSPDTAGLDPVFWVHHCNIDRLWALWECGDQRQWGVVPSSGWLDEAPWFFTDHDGSVANHPRRFFLDRRNFTFTYDSDTPACTALSVRDPIESRVALIADARMTNAVESRSFVERDAGTRVPVNRAVGPDRQVDLSIPLDSLAAARDRSLKSRIESADPAKPVRIMLEVSEIEMAGVPTVGYDVHVNLRAGEVAARESPSHVGTLSLFRAGHSQAAGHPNWTQRFDITDAVRRDDDGQAIVVSLAPFDLYAPIGDKPRLRRDDQIKIGSVRIILVEGQTEP
jgi:hypothetical protein